MTDQDPKSVPGGMPPDRDAMSSMVGAFRRTPDQGGDVDVRLSIRGGVHGEAFELYLTASSRGDMSCKLQCNLSQRAVDRDRLRIDPQVVNDIIERLDLETLLKEPPRQSGFPPDSLIGQLEVEVGGQTTVIYFMADPEQARTAGVEPPEQVMRVVEVLYGEAEKRVGIASVRP